MNTTTLEPKEPMTRRQIILILILCLLLLGGIAGQMLRDRWSGPPLEELIHHGQLPAYRININAADVAELSLLPGIGPGRAARIIAYRQEHGPFKAVEDLARVPGITRKIASQLTHYATIE